jgi:hypothetical protein
VSEQVPEGIELPLRWVGIEETPLLVANQFLGQVTPTDAILNVGEAIPPTILPSDLEQQGAQLEKYEYVTVKTIARLGLNRLTLEQLIGVLQQTLLNYDQIHQASRGTET